MLMSLVKQGDDVAASSPITHSVLCSVFFVNKNKKTSQNVIYNHVMVIIAGIDLGHFA
jgi:hypothetical protein